MNLFQKEENRPISFARIESRKAPRNYKIWIILITSISLVLFGLYIHKYQQLVNEGSYLADEHCIKVNPLIINRKKAYIEQYNTLLASPSSSLYMNSLIKYNLANEAYIEEEKKWLPKQRSLIDSRDFQLFMPSFTKEAAEAQYAMYEGEYLSSFYLMQGFEEPDKNKQEELSNKVLQETDRRVAAEKKYNEIWDKNDGVTDWRYKYFVKVPTPTCPKENYDIPEVPNIFEKPIFPNSPLS